MLCFIHITKTAGGTVKKILRDGDVQCQFHYPGEEGFSPLFEYSSSNDVVYGHYKFGAHEKIGVQPNYACFVREPISRTISHFYHLKNVAKAKIGDKAREAGDIKTFLTKYRPLDLDNLQTRMISGVGRNTGYGGLRNRALNLAKNNLENYFSYVGVFERLNDSLDLLRQNFPDLHIDQLPHVNQGKYAEETDEEAIELIKQFNRLDFEVYHTAVELFDKAYSERQSAAT